VALAGDDAAGGAHPADVTRDAIALVELHLAAFREHRAADLDAARVVLEHGHADFIALAVAQMTAALLTSNPDADRWLAALRKGTQSAWPER
jgi:hypothetical protein